MPYIIYMIRNKGNLYNMIKETLKPFFFREGYLQLGDELVALLDPSNGIVDELINDGLGGLLLVNNGSSLAHEERTESLKRVIVLIVTENLNANLLGSFLGGLLIASAEVLVEISLVGDGTLGGERLHLFLTAGLPVVNVRVVADAHGATGENDCADVVVVAGSADSLLVGARSTSLVGENETSSDPDGIGTHHERSSEELTVVNTTSGNDVNGTTSERGLVALDGLNDGGDEDSGGNVTSVTTTLTTLGADDIDTDVNALLDVLDVANHVHVGNTSLVELVDDGLGGDTDGRDKQLGAGLDNNVDELIELALGVIVAAKSEGLVAVD